MLGNKKIDQIDSFAYLDSIINKGSGRSGDLKTRKAKAQGVYSQSKFSERIGR